MEIPLSLQDQGLWSKAQLKWHINCQELMAVFLTLQKFIYLLKNRTIKVRTDNIAVRQYIKKEGATGSPTLCKLTLQLLSWCSLIAEHVPGIQNSLADPLSHWMVSQRRSIWLIELLDCVFLPWLFLTRPCLYKSYLSIPPSFSPWPCCYYISWTVFWTMFLIRWLYPKCACYHW